MQEICYCGRIGEVEDRRPVTDTDGRPALQCPDCGHLDHLSWLPADDRRRLLAGVQHLAHEPTVPAA